MSELSNRPTMRQSMRDSGERVAEWARPRTLTGDRTVGNSDGQWASINHGRNMDDPWINGSITGCAYRAALILGR